MCLARFHHSLFFTFLKSFLRVLLPSSLLVIIMCMHSILVGGKQQATFLLKAREMGLTSGRYVFVPYDTLHYSVPYSNVSYDPLQNNSRLREAYDAVLTITVASEPLSFSEAFAAAKRNQEVTVAVQPEEVPHSITQSLFNSVLNLYSAAQNYYLS